MDFGSISWPEGVELVPVDQRIGRRGSTIDLMQALETIARAVAAIGGEELYLSSNLRITKAGSPALNQNINNIADSEVVIYFLRNDEWTALPSSRYKTVTNNISAIADHIEATRTIARHGVMSLDQIYSVNVLRLCTPGERDWREVLGFKRDEPVDLKVLKMRRNDLARKHHPDLHSMVSTQMAEVNAAFDAARREIE
ncbi:hypothetical protein [Lichenicola sp.]|uniref:hypothetical protein n=1 Tax=Lichenicola sp. TaxID=2804529 RepID=UPI003B0095DB